MKRKLIYILLLLLFVSCSKEDLHQEITQPAPYMDSEVLVKFTPQVAQLLAQASYDLANELGLIQSYAAVSSEYFYQDGVFYMMDSDGEYKVIVPPAGALVETLPEDYEMVTLGGEEYYKVDDTVYKVTLSDGKPFFEVLGQLYS